jgi:hypothetical protein
MPEEGHFRAQGRRKVNVAASLRRRAAAPPEPIRIVDLSLSGACIEAAERMGEGAWVTVDIPAPTPWDPLSLRAMVVWSEGRDNARARTGLMFEHTDERPAFALFELLAALATEP